MSLTEFLFGTAPSEKPMRLVEVHETCPCGATFDATGLHSWVSYDAQQFRAAHRECRRSSSPAENQAEARHIEEHQERKHGE